MIDFIVNFGMKIVTIFYDTNFFNFFNDKTVSVEQTFMLTL